MDRKHSGGINIGTSQILVTFVLLSLVTFAALSYMSARSDYTLSVESAKRTASYYDANRMAELYLANIEGLLAKHYSKCTNEEEYLQGVDRIFSDNDRIKVETVDEKVTMSYEVAVTNGQNLYVTLVAHYPNKDNGQLFYVAKWSTGINTQWLEKVTNEGNEESGVKLLF